MIVALEELPSYRAMLAGKVVATNGCFDLLHPGHLDSLTRAARMGNHLIVGLNSDDSVRQHKGDSRPIIAQAGRAAMLDALKCVTAVVIYPQLSAAEFLRAVRPHLWVKGSEYSGRVNPDEQQILIDCKAQIVFLPTLAGYSTTEILRKAA